MVVPLLYADINYLRPDAITAHLLASSNNQLYDVIGCTQSPYYARRVFAAAPSIGYASTSRPTFIFKPELFYNASARSLSSISIDFGDGRGYLAVSWGIPIAAAYTAVGSYTQKIKIAFTDNSTVECYSVFQVTKLQSVQYAAAQLSSCSFSQSFPAQVGVHSGGTVYLRYGSSNSSCQLQKPLIVAEGYDVSSIAPLLQDNYSFNNFLQDINVSFISSGNFFKLIGTRKL